MFRDGQRLADGARLEFDVVIIGAGMAGIVLADRLGATGRRVCLIESGGLDPKVSAQRLSVGENVGRSYFDLDRCRFRVFGGSSIRWGGWCRPLDPLDFAARSWIPASGWPIGREELRRHYAEAAGVLGLRTPSCDLRDWSDLLPAPPSLAGPDFEPAVIQHGRLDFGERWRARFRADPDVTVLLHANVTELMADRSGSRIEHVRIATRRGRRFRISAGQFVLAAGGVENARLLLVSNARHVRGLGNDADLVGRCFMEHLHVVSGYLEQTRGPVPAFFAHEVGEHDRGHGVLVATEQALTEHQLPACSVSLIPVGSPPTVIPRLNWPTPLMTASERAARRLRRRLPTADQRLRRAALTAWKAGHTARPVHWETHRDMTSASPGAAIHLRAEQVPNRDSRVTLAASRDIFGVPRARLDWQLTAQDLAAVRRWREPLSAALAGSGLGRVVELEGREHRIIGGPHHMGTTRMSATPSTGVVDANCRVHGIDNLYVAGSSVFATGGHANPSFTILALALRLAEHLNQTGSPDPAPRSSCAPAQR